MTSSRSQGAKWVVAATLVAAALVWVAAGRAQQPAGGGSSEASGPVVARVGALAITAGELDARVEQTVRQLRARTGAGIAPAQQQLLRRQILESLIWQRLATLEGERRGIPPRSIAEEYQRRAQPDRRELEREVRRRMTMAEIAYLPLRRSDFLREPYPPRELEVLDWYRRHPNEFPRPAESQYSAIVVDQPPLPESQAFRVDLRREWEAMIQRRADSVAAALRSGARFEELALHFGGARRFVVAEGRPFHPDFRGTEAELQQVRSAAPGTVLPGSFAWNPGRVLLRVDARLPRHPAPLGEVASQILERMQAEAPQRLDAGRLRPLYDRLADSLRAPAQEIRYALIDTTTRGVAMPTPAEIERYYRLHQADYSSFDAVRGALVTTPLEEVRGGIAERMLRDRRFAAARDHAERLAVAWGQGRRDARLEGAPARTRDLGLVLRGSELDTGSVARVVRDSLERRGWSPGIHVLASPARFVVVALGPLVPDHRPTFEQARADLARRLADADAAALEQEARALWERQPERLRRGTTIHLARLMVAPEEVVDVPLTRAEVESYYRVHLADYSAPALARVSHILVSPSEPTPAAEADARRRAQELLERARSGENWERLVQEHSADEATRDRGGDVGTFNPGTMLPEFEAAAFAMRPGEIGGPIRTREGWHVLRCVENQPQEIVPLRYCYANVAADLAAERSAERAAHRADSLVKVMKSPADAPAIARRFGYRIYTNEHVVGERNMLRDLVGFFEEIERTPPGRFVSRPQLYRGMGIAIGWVDSITPARVPSWGLARARALELAKEDRAEREVRARQAALDSLFRAGWSLDSVAALRGGLERRVLEGSGRPLVQLGGTTIVDSLVFGVRDREAALAVGRESGWIEFPGGPVRLRVEARSIPGAVALEARTEETWKAAAERRLYQLFEDLKRRHAVRILDPDLAATKPPIPNEP